MSSIGGLTSTSSSSISGYGGLASGLDRDSLIEGMTIGTQTKIDNANRDMQELKWEQEAYQDITKELYEFTQKYTSFSSDSNLLSSTLFAMSEIGINGANSNYVSVEGSSTTQTPLEILGVKSLAKNALATSSDRISSGTISSKSLDSSLSASASISSVVGDSITFKYGDKNFTVNIANEDGLTLEEMDSPEEIAALINKSMEDVTLSDGKTLADVAEFSASGGKITIKNIDTDGNALELVSGTGDVLADLGIVASGEGVSSLGEDGAVITGAGLTGANNANVVKEQTMAEALSGASIRFEYNGKNYDIELGDLKNTDSIADLQAELQSKINSQIGQGRVNVSFDSSNALVFQTVLPNGDYDPNSSFSLVSADENILGENGLLGIEAGASNRLNTSKSLAESGLSTSVDTSLDMIIKNGAGEEINLADYDINWDSSLDEIMETLNSIDELGIEVKYQKETDKFTITSTYDGAAGEIDLSGTLADAMFGTGLTVQDGQDAVVSVKYASGEVAEITRGSNTIVSEGLEITVSGEFGYKEQVNADGTTSLVLDETQEAVTFDTGIDTEKAAEIVKEFIDEYNDILENINSQIKERPDSDYYALTSDEKKEMSESEIELWEEEAKKGLLYGDSTLSSLADDLRFMIPATLRQQFEDIGITVSSSYSDNGKLVFDQTKFESALKEDPDNVYELLSEDSKYTDNGVNGLVTSVRDVMDKYAGMSGATKGLLVEKAGSEFAPTSVLENTMLDLIEDMQEKIDGFEYTLEMEIDRYTKQFTALETLISEMNSQSSYLSSLQF